ncbi:MAG: hypothetical protein H6741_12295 [Alphaproteobacteria bacterium]|nr:hypothetical protein [Alphaproteobacteria bacterium]MCB9793494.1 hypothetical protein [Alphaproteobacteria bacterium]
MKASSTLVRITCFAALLLTWPAQAEVIDRVVSVVDDRVVTASDLGFEQEFAVHDRSPLPFYELGQDALTRVEDYRILRAQAADVEAFQPRAEEVELRLEAFRTSWARQKDYEAFLLRWGMDEERLREQLYARMVVERFVTRNLGLTAEDLAQPERAIARYEAWMAPRRAAVAVRRVPPIDGVEASTYSGTRPEGRAPDR